MGERPGEVEVMVIDKAFWKGQRVFLTGHTGLKGAWMALILKKLGAHVSGFAKEAEHANGVFSAARVAELIDHEIGDICDLSRLSGAIQRARPSIVLHMAAQSLVRASYDDPIGTYATNVMGTANVLETCRNVPGIKAIVVVTSDKCYENMETRRAFVEDDKMGGHDPYSSSKGCAELVTSAYRRSFFNSKDAPLLASVRAGNVIGGGDWAANRLVPDAMRAFIAGEELRIRSPQAVRPWQHVLDALIGYMVLTESLIKRGQPLVGGWNFGPDATEFLPVSSVVTALVEKWGDKASWAIDEGHHPHEANFLGLDCTKARTVLNWHPVMHINKALDFCVQWYKASAAGKDMHATTMAQIESVLP